MKHFILLLSLLGLVALAAAAETGADQWAQWRGPLGTGASPKGDPPMQWDEKTNIAWKAPLPGKGSSTPIIWGERIFLQTAVDTGRQAAPADIPKADAGFERKTAAPTTHHQFLVLCLDRRTGKERWRHVAVEQVPHEGRHPTHSYAAFSPATDGQRLVVSFGSRGVYCYDLDGKLLWKRDLGRMNTRYGWGEATSPVLHGETVILNWDQEKGSYLLALNAKTGEPHWKVERDEPTSWATPLVVEHQGRTQVIVSGTNKVRGYDLADGKTIWECGGQSVNCIPSPILWKDQVICMSGYRGHFACSIPLDSKGDVTGKTTWRYTQGTPYVPSALLVGDRLYFTQFNTAVLTSLDVKSGKPIIDRQRLPGLGQLYASPTAAAGRIYIPDREGTTMVLKQGDKVEVLALNRLEDSFDASPVVIGKQLFLRGTRHLYCIEQK